MAPSGKKRKDIISFDDHKFDHEQGDLEDLEAVDSGTYCDNDQNETILQRDKKKHKTAAAKELTAEDIQGLRETEELFKNNLFRWQLNELLKRYQVNYEKCGILEKAFWRVKELLESAPAVKEQSFVEAIDLLRKKHGGVQLPVEISAKEMKSIKYRLAFEPPTVVRVIGSYMTRSVLQKSNPSADIAVEIPKSILQPKDFLNNRYFYKRAYFLALLAAHLRTEYSAGVSVEYSLPDDGDTLRPILVLKSVPGDQQHSPELDFTGKTRFSIRIIPCVASDMFSPAKLSPSRNCLRQTDVEDRCSQASSPYYNNSLLAEMQPLNYLQFLYQACQSCPALGHAMVLMKLWLSKRQFDRQGLSGFLVSMLMAHWQQSGVLRLSWSSYQLFRVAMQQLTKFSKLSSFAAGEQQHQVTISMASKEQMARHGFSIEQFCNSYDVVIICPQGMVNLASNVSLGAWHRMAAEAEQTVRLLNDSTGQDRFDFIFPQATISLPLNFDYMCEMAGDFAKPPRSSFPPAVQVERLLREALGRRFRLICAFPSAATPATTSWAVDKHFAPTDVSMTIGMLVDPAKVQSLVDQGPPGDDRLAGERFKQLWGDRAELRRFSDGSILHSVVWKSSDDKQKSGDEDDDDDVEPVVALAVKYLLGRHFGGGSGNGPTKITFIGSQVLPLLRQPKGPYTLLSDNSVMPIIKQSPSGDSSSLLTAFAEFRRQLRSLEGLPLTIIDLRPSHSALSHTSVAIPRPFPKKQLNRLAAAVMPLVEPVDVVIETELTVRWPTLLSALRRVRSAFYIRLAQLLESTSAGGDTSATVVSTKDCSDDCLIVLSSAGYCFRLRLHVPYEAKLLEQEQQKQQKQQQSAERDGERVKESIDRQLCRYQFQYLLKPAHTLLMQSLIAQFPSLAHTIRLVKRWAVQQWIPLTACNNFYQDGNDDNDDVIITNFSENSASSSAAKVPEEFLELLCVKVYSDPFPLHPPGTPWLGLLRVLSLLAHFPFRHRPLVVEMEQGSLRAAETWDDIERRFRELRKHQSIATGDCAAYVAAVYSLSPSSLPGENGDSESGGNRMRQCARLWLQSVWTQAGAGPDLLLLQRLQQLAHLSLSRLLLPVVANDESLPRLQLDSIMQHDQSVYDAVICLRPMYCARLQESLVTISHPPSTLPRVGERYKNMVNGTKADRILTGIRSFETILA